MDERKRQKKLAKQKSKQRRQKQEAALVKQLLTSKVGRMQSASGGRVLQCFLSDTAHMEQNGMVVVTLVRSAPQGQVAFANYMVDLWCLGVKDCSGNVMDSATCREIIDEVTHRMVARSIAPAQAHAVLVAGVSYAQSLGLAPHADYAKLAPIWTGIPVGSLPSGLDVGRNGRPCYVVGPYDDKAKQNMVLRALFESVGEGNFDFISRLSQQQDGISFERLVEPQHQLLLD